MNEKIILSWSGGKDSALALYELMRQGYTDITLLTTITDKYERISMHGVRKALLEKQAKSIGCYLEKVYITPESTNEEYEKKMEETMNRYKKLGAAKVAFGDIFLEDIRKYREENLRRAGMEAIFPLWGRDTKEIADTFINLGFKSIITCVDTKVLNGDFSGRLYDKNFLANLPENINSCGENGEFHSFAFDGPIFKERINFSVGKRVLRDERFNFCDLI
ncbi:diphthine--ammonia ligase [Clostridium sp. JN-9]|uniref:Dph6-related ATP pyrophosphatase n=1 Tax=Clostridium sp. JN-9 TaxID=2507159 RepID=UPI0013E8C5EB|nr:diphthine--ammonia ligase [Clostridium sp. JN-9]